MEFLIWCEDMGLMPIPVLWNGFALSAGGNTPFTGPALEPYIKDALNQIEVLIPNPNPNL